MLFEYIYITYSSASTVHLTHCSAFETLKRGERLHGSRQIPGQKYCM